MSFLEELLSALVRAGIASADAWYDDGSVNLLDGSIPNICKVFMTAQSGCGVNITCGDMETSYGYPMAQCYKDGVNSYNDPGIGPFTITWDGGEYNGGVEQYSYIDGPLLSVDYVANGAQLDCDAEADQTTFNGGSHIEVKGQDITVEICEGNIGSQDIECGIPKIGANAPGLDSEGPTNDRGYAPGWCGMHVTQYQKPNPATDNYKYDVTIYDANQDQIGQVKGLDIATDQTSSMDSKLPWTLDITSGAVDADAVCFAYSDQRWCSNDSTVHFCKFGAYDSGNRDGDCGFTC